MDINKVLMEYDNMFGVHTMEEIEDFLVRTLDKAYEEQDEYSALSLMNEMVGFYRDTCQKEKGLSICSRLIALMNKLNLGGTIDYATSLINVANAYRAFGLFDKSLEAFEDVERIYRDKLPAGEFNYASLYNNWSLLYQEMNDFESARSMLMKALSVVDLFPKAVIQRANTRTNLAATLLRLNAMDEALRYLSEALDIYEADGGRDFHYSAALSAMGDALYMQSEFDRSAEFYKKAMQELDKHIGRTEAYARVEKNYLNAVKQAEEARSGQRNRVQKSSVQSDEAAENDIFTSNPHIYNNNMERCLAFYEMYGAPMIHEQFGEYEDRIAVGLVGEGSDCFGFDDSISADHDYGVGFCMWLKDEDYDRIGFALHKVYERLVLEHGKEFIDVNTVNNADKFIDGRRGVFRIYSFYEELTGVNVRNYQMSEQEWLCVSENKLATATNGMVFRDDEGIFTGIRESLKAYYPRRVWLLRIAQRLHDFSQCAQSNYGRMMARCDYVTASICVADGMRYAMELAYLLDRSYAPYYKWLRKGMSRLNVLREIVPILDNISVMGSQEDAWHNIYNPYEINREDRIVVMFEDVAAWLLDELNRQGIVRGSDTFLDVYVNGIVETAMMKKEELIEQIVGAEWKQFDTVKNEGGRADCQDDWNTFSLMRKSQYMAWNEELLASYLRDLEEADKDGWNLIMEKYARMMKSTAPERYAELEGKLPKRDEERLAIQEEIIRIQVAWMEDFASKYPKMARNARSIHTAEDNPFNTSYETYLRGELGTYSDDTFLLYGRFIVEIQASGRNLAYMIMENTAELYGYKSVEDAESRL